MAAGGGAAVDADCGGHIATNHRFFVPQQELGLGYWSRDGDESGAHVLRLVVYHSDLCCPPETIVSARLDDLSPVCGSEVLALRGLANISHAFSMLTFAGMG